MDFDTSYFPYGQMKGINKNIYKKFRRTCDLNTKHIIIHLTKEYLHKYNDIHKMIYERSEFIGNVKTYLMDEKWVYHVLHSFYGAIVDFIIEKKSSISDDEIYILFQYISPEKMYDLILYTKPSHINLFDKIYQTILSNSFIISIINYQYTNINLIEEVVYPYYLIIKKLQNDNILYHFQPLQDIQLDILVKKCNDAFYTQIIYHVIDYIQKQIQNKYQS